MQNLTEIATSNDTLAASQALPGQAAGSALAIVHRVADAIDAETASIRSDPSFDLKASNERKSRHLYELSKAFKGLDGARVSADHRQAILRLREKLTVNEATIRAHLDAVSEIAGLLQETIERTQADGTYSEREFGQASLA